MVSVLELDGRDHADLAVKSPVIEPVDVFRGRDLEVVDVLPGPAVADQFSLERLFTVRGDGERRVAGVERLVVLL